MVGNDCFHPKPMELNMVILLFPTQGAGSLRVSAHPKGSSPRRSGEMGLVPVPPFPASSHRGAGGSGCPSKRLLRCQCLFFR